MKKNMVLSIAICLVLSATAAAALQTGDREFSLFGNYTKFNGAESGGSTDSGGAGLSVGWSLSNEWQWGLQGFGNWDNAGDLYAAGTFLKYYFCPQNKTIPYLGAQANYAYYDNDSTEEGILWGPVAGLKFFVNDTTDLFVEYQYHFYDGGGGIRKVLDEANAVVAGLSFKF